MKGLRKNCNYIYKHIDTEYSVTIARGKGGWRQVEVGNGREMGPKRDFGAMAHSAVCR